MPSKRSCASCLPTRLRAGTTKCGNRNKLDYLPTIEQQRFLILAFAELVSKSGNAHLLSMPIVEPTPKFFPERWNFSPTGLDRVVRRLMQYALLSDLNLRLITFKQLHSKLDPQHGCPYVVAGAFMGIENGTCGLAF